jgi:SAM-dependent methyltransferase
MCGCPYSYLFIITQKSAVIPSLAKSTRFCLFACLVDKRHGGMEIKRTWSLDLCRNDQYRHKFTDVVRILAEWFEPYGGFEGKDILEFGCGEGTVALGLALQHRPRRVVGVEILDVYKKCLPFARDNLGLESLPDILSLHKIAPGAGFADLGKFDCVFTWSVFEHVSQEFLPEAFEMLKKALKPGGVIFLQISPLYYSRDGSHLAPWIPVPWGHLALQADDYYKRLLSAPATPDHLRSSWSVYIPMDAEQAEERRVLWETYDTLNKATAPQLARLAAQAGLKIVRDYRTRNDDPIPSDLAEIFNEDVLRTEQIVWMLQSADCPAGRQ